jgi:hypothetical protein
MSIGIPEDQQVVSTVDYVELVALDPCEGLER